MQAENHRSQLARTNGTESLILGEPLMWLYYTVYDWGSDGGPQIGFARAMNRRYQKLQATAPEPESSDDVLDYIVLFQTDITVNRRAQRRPVVIVPPIAGAQNDD